MKQAKFQRFKEDPGNTSVETNYPGLLGAIIFVAGIALMFLTENFYFILLSVSGLLFAMLAVWLKARRKRSAWRKVKANCLDREIRRVRTPQGGYTWIFRLRCEFDFEGRHYEIAPEPYWTTFISEKSLLKFLDEIIAADGSCWLYVNPAEPEQTELVGNGVKDWLLHSSEGPSSAATPTRPKKGRELSSTQFGLHLIIPVIFILLIIGIMLFMEIFMNSFF